MYEGTNRLGLLTEISGPLQPEYLRRIDAFATLHRTTCNLATYGIGAPRLSVAAGRDLLRTRLELEVFFESLVDEVLAEQQQSVIVEARVYDWLSLSHSSSMKTLSRPEPSTTFTRSMPLNSVSPTIEALKPRLARLT